MTSNLRFHSGDDPRPEKAPTPEIAACVYRFPADRARARARLVAGAVDKTPLPGPAHFLGNGDGCGDGCADDDFPAPGRSGVIGRTFGPRAGERMDDGVTTSDELVRQIEVTLERMQGRLDRVKRQVDEVFKFPDVSGDEGPRAA